MKIVTTLIALLTLVVGTNIFLRVQDQDRIDTALLLLDERISSNTTTITNVEEYIVDTTLTFENMQYIMMDNIKDVATSLEKHKHEPVYVEVPVVPEVPSVKIKTEPKPVETETLERIYDPETQLHVPNLPVPVVVCPKANNNLGKFIEDVTLRRDYKFFVTYDILDNKLNNVRFDKKIPSKLKSAMIQYINSFRFNGDVKNCKISIKVLEN
jgi:hypothetical protein|tara:strand:+ start:248 stop:883 length:636 start_codon:yes stop_codon:yes gene_type:complete